MNRLFYDIVNDVNNMKNTTILNDDEVIEITGPNVYGLQYLVKMMHDVSNKLSSYFWACQWTNPKFISEDLNYWFYVICNGDKMFFFNAEEAYVVENDEVVKVDDVEALMKTFMTEVGYEKFYVNQYKYCDAIIDNFWKLVFNKTAKEMWCDGITCAHGDKAYGYKDDWKKAGIPFNRGVMMFLLTYTSLLDREKCESCEWVIDNYPKYIAIFEQVEQEIFGKVCYESAAA